MKLWANVDFKLERQHVKGALTSRNSWSGGLLLLLLLVALIVRYFHVIVQVNRTRGRSGHSSMKTLSRLIILFVDVFYRICKRRMKWSGQKSKIILFYLYFWCPLSSISSVCTGGRLAGTDWVDTHLRANGNKIGSVFQGMSILRSYDWIENRE